jgi:hypothetical protein
MVETIEMDAALTAVSAVEQHQQASVPALRATAALAMPTAGPIALLNSGIADLEKLERLWELQVRFEQREAEKAFNEAMAAFKANPPVIVKDKHVHFVGQKGATDYDHATHFGVTTAIAEALAKHGLSHSWTSTQADGKITVACTIKHRLGHSESTSMEAAYDASGGKNAIQAIGSAKTYLERYTLLGITGLSTQDLPDDDGAGTETPGSVVETVLDGLLADLTKCTTDKQAADLWASGSKTLAALKHQQAYADFKDSVVAHRTALKNGGVK